MLLVAAVASSFGGVHDTRVNPRHLLRHCQFTGPKHVQYKRHYSHLANGISRNLVGIVGVSI